MTRKFLFLFAATACLSFSITTLRAIGVANAQEAQKEIALTVSPAELNTLGKALGTLPYSEVAALMIKLQGQVAAQQQPKPATNEGGVEVSFIKREQDRNALRDFAIALQREVCVRTGSFGPDNASSHEQRWAREGACMPTELDTFETFKSFLR